MRTNLIVDIRDIKSHPDRKKKKDIKSLSIETLFDRRLFIQIIALFNVLYRPPSGPAEPFESL